MAWIRVIEEDEADPTLRSVYEQVQQTRGKVANILKIQSLRPAAMQEHLHLYRTVMFQPSTVSRQEREMIAVAVSAANHCAYCVAHHAQALKHYWEDVDRIDALIERGDAPGVSPRGRAMLRYAVKLTREPERMGEADIEALRDAGLSDSEILDVAHIVAYFNFVNRMAVGLGVEFSEEEKRGYVHGSEAGR